MDLLNLPDNVIMEILKKVTPDDIDCLRRTCQVLGEFIDSNRNRLPSRELLHLDLDHRRIRAWHDSSWCDWIPFDTFEYCSRYFTNVSTRVLTLIEMDDEVCEWLTMHCRFFNFRFEQLRVYHSFLMSHKSIATLIEQGRCQTLSFDSLDSNLKSEYLAYNGYQNLRSVCFEIDSSLKEEHFFNLYDLPNCVNFIFHSCDGVSKEFIHSIFKRFLDGSKKIETIRVGTNKDISFDTILKKFPRLIPVHPSIWKLENSQKDTAIITVRRNAYHFFLAFEVNDHRIEDILYRVPKLE